MKRRKRPAESEGVTEVVDLNIQACTEPTLEEMMERVDWPTFEEMIERATMSKRKPNPLKGQWTGDAGLRRVLDLSADAAQGHWPDAPHEGLMVLQSWALAAEAPRDLDQKLNGLGRRRRSRVPKKSERERCGAWARSRGRPCQAPCYRRPDGTLSNRCRLHGGASIGPKTPEGKRRALANLKQNRHR